jgi:RNA polymerase sigma factor (sigma-70 family)
MEAAPGHEPEPSKRQSLARRDDVLDALDVLDERERFVVESLVFEKISQQTLARRMNLSRRTVRDIADKAMAKLRRELSPKGYG